MIYSLKNYKQIKKNKFKRTMRFKNFLLEKILAFYKTK